MIVDPEKLDLLKEPFGILIKDDLVNRESITQMLRFASKIVTVGDTTTEKFIGFEIMPDISVIDGKEKRVVKTTKLEYKVDEVLKFKNNPGELAEEIVSAIMRLVSQKTTQEEYDKHQNSRTGTIENSSKRIQIAIDGEEDVVALPFLIYAPVGWVVCYGQPNEGLVVVRITKESKKRAESIFNKVFL